MHQIAVMTDADVVVKGELHNSVADLEDEKKLLEDEVSYLVLEHAEEDSKLHLRYIWFHALMWMLTNFFFRRLYTDPTPLEELTLSHEGDIKRTRSSDVEIIENASLGAELAALLMFLSFTTTSLLIGVFFAKMGAITTGGGLFILGTLIPPLALRVRESSRTDCNRDEIIAEKIAEAAEGGGRVVAVVGHRHRDDVMSYLPEWIDAEPQDPVYDWYHPRALLGLVFAVITLITLYGSLYVGIIAVLRVVLLFLV